MVNKASNFSLRKSDDPDRSVAPLSVLKIVSSDSSDPGSVVSGVTIVSYK